MEINLSDESVNIIVNSLRSSKQNLKSQINKWQKINEPSKAEICEAQLSEIEDVLAIFEEVGY